MPLENPGFESGMEKWTHWAESRGCIAEASAEVAWEGGKSLHMSNINAEGKGRMWVAQTIQGVEPDSMYMLSVKAKSSASPQGSVRVGLKLEFYDFDGKNTGGVNEFMSLVQDADWDELRVVGRADAEAASVKILLRLYTQGTVFFDNVELSQPEILLDEPARLTHTPGQPVEVRLVAWVNAADDAKSLPALSIEATHNGKTTMHEPAVEPLGNHRYALTATLPAIEAGHYDLNVAFNGAHSPRGARTFASHAKRQPAGLSNTGTILHNGKPFFPIGMYHPRNLAHYQAGGKTDGVESGEESFPLLASHGFNAVQGHHTNDIDALGRDLDLALQHGLALDVPLYAGNRVAKNLPNSLEKIARYKKHPALLSWKISDEPDLRPEVVDEVPDVYYALKEADADTPIEVTMATDEKMASWVNFMDIVQIDRYPIPGKHLTAVSAFTRLAMQAKAPWQNVSFVVQCGWGGKDLSNQPTAAQARCMVYLALIEGAKGIWWYSMYDPGWDLTKTPLWPELKAINEEIHALSEPLMLGTLQREVKSSNAKVHTRALKHGGKLYILATNPEATAEKTTLQLPTQGLNANGTTLDGTAVAAQAGGIQLELPPYAARTLIFQYKHGE